MSATDDAPRIAGGSKAAAISNLTVRLLSQYTGRGPTKARTFFNDDMVTVVLQDTLTKAEITLVGTGHQETVLSTRKTFQDVMGPDLIAGVEQVTGRTVIAFLSANHVDPDVAVESFLLAPVDNGSGNHDGAGPTG
jgi:uncharacterized protein YbcI